MDEQRKLFYGALFNAGELVFDVGANMGNRSKVFRKLGARVVAFEPQDYCADFLEAAFAGDRNFNLARLALSESAGEMILHTGEAHTLSSLDNEWIERMKDGGRFAHHHWDKGKKVPVITLDQAIKRFGLPTFIKIDVEGHELSVIRGLSQPVQVLSLEFASEYLDKSHECLDHLESLGNYRYRISLAETMQFNDNRWSDKQTILRHLDTARDKDPMVWGDIYARLEE